MNKTMLVVGASGGIGKSVTDELLRAGYFVIGTYCKHPEKLEDITTHNHFKSLPLNIQDVNDIKKFAVKIDQQIFALVNCTGIVEFEGKNLDDDIKIWNKTIATNLSSNYYLAKVFADKLEEKGRFLMISSTDSFYGGKVTAAYAASKAGVNSLTKSLALLFSEKKIRVNSIAPGWVSTPMIEGNSKEFYEKLAEINPLKRIAQPQDVANLIAFLLSEKADYINGQVITLDGGYTNQDPTLLIEGDQ